MAGPNLSSLVPPAPATHSGGGATPDLSSLVPDAPKADLSQFVPDAPKATPKKKGGGGFFHELGHIAHEAKAGTAWALNEPAKGATWLTKKASFGNHTVQQIIDAPVTFGYGLGDTLYKGATGLVHDQVATWKAGLHGSRTDEVLGLVPGGFLANSFGVRDAVRGAVKMHEANSRYLQARADYRAATTPAARNAAALAERAALKDKNAAAGNIFDRWHKTGQVFDKIGRPGINNTVSHLPGTGPMAADWDKQGALYMDKNGNAVRDRSQAVSGYWNKLKSDPVGTVGAAIAVAAPLEGGLEGALGDAAAAQRLGITARAEEAGADPAAELQGSRLQRANTMINGKRPLLVRHSSEHEVAKRPTFGHSHLFSGRLRQQLVHTAATKIGDAAGKILPADHNYFGQDARYERLVTKQNKQLINGQARSVLHAFDKATRGLSADEQIAVTLHAHGVKPSEYQHYYDNRAEAVRGKLARIQHADKPTPQLLAHGDQLVGELRDIQKMQKVIGYVTDADWERVAHEPHLQAARAAIEHISNVTGDVLEKAGQLDPKSRVLSAFRHARVVKGGAKFIEQTLGDHLHDINMDDELQLQRPKTEEEQAAFHRQFADPAGPKSLIRSRVRILSEGDRKGTIVQLDPQTLEATVRYDHPDGAQTEAHFPLHELVRENEKAGELAGGFGLPVQRTTNPAAREPWQMSRGEYVLQRKRQLVAEQAQADAAHEARLAAAEREQPSHGGHDWHALEGDVVGPSERQTLPELRKAAARAHAKAQAARQLAAELHTRFEQHPQKASDEAAGQYHAWRYAQEQAQLAERDAAAADSAVERGQAGQLALPAPGRHGLPPVPAKGLPPVEQEGVVWQPKADEPLEEQTTATIPGTVQDLIDAQPAVFRDITPEDMRFVVVDPGMPALEAEHRAAVVQALRDGQPVPERAVEDYGDLANAAALAQYADAAGGYAPVFASDLDFGGKGGGPGQPFRKPSGGSGFVQKLPLVQRWRGQNLWAARWLPHPSKWRSSFLMTVGYMHAWEQARLAQEIGQHVSADFHDLNEGWHVVRIDRGAPGRVARERSTFHRTLDSISAEGEKARSSADFNKWLSDEVVSDQADQIARWKDWHEDGVHYVQISPATYTRLFGGFKETNAMLKNFVDRPTNAWRTMTLTYRVAWVVNNIVGQSLLYALHFHTPAAAKWYAQSALYGIQEARAQEARQLMASAPERSQLLSVLRTKMSPSEAEYALALVDNLAEGIAARTGENPTYLYEQMQLNVAEGRIDPHLLQFDPNTLFQGHHWNGLHDDEVWHDWLARADENQQMLYGGPSDQVSQHGQDFVGKAWQQRENGELPQPFLHGQAKRDHLAGQRQKLVDYLEAKQPGSSDNSDWLAEHDRRSQALLEDERQLFAEPHAGETPTASRPSGLATGEFDAVPARSARPAAAPAHKASIFEDRERMKQWLQDAADLYGPAVGNLHTRAWIDGAVEDFHNGRLPQPLLNAEEMRAGGLSRSALADRQDAIFSRLQDTPETTRGRPSPFATGLLQEDGSTVKGMVQFADDQRFILHLFKDADVSTVIHESAHVLRRLMNPDDLAEVEQVYGIKDGTWTRTHEERFAREFEQYVVNGKPPTLRLRAAFAALRDALVRIYRSAAGLGLEVDPRVAAVFDRYLADQLPRAERVSLAGIPLGSYVHRYWGSGELGGFFQHEAVGATAGTRRLSGIPDAVRTAYQLAEDNSKHGFREASVEAVKESVLWMRDFEHRRRAQINHFNAAVSDDLERRAAFWHLADRERKVYNRLHGLQVDFDKWLDMLEQNHYSLRGNDPELTQIHAHLVQEVLDTLVDFGNLNQFERNVLRRIFPFYSWMKGACKSLTKYVVDNPVEAFALYAIAQANDAHNEEVYGPTAKLLQGTELLGRIGMNGNYHAWSMNAWNPAATGAQVAQGFAGMFKGSTHDPADNLLGQTNPLIQSAIEAATRRDSAGRAVTGSQPEIFLKQLLSSIPLVGTLEDAFTPKRGLNKQGAPHMTVPGGHVRVLGINVPMSIANYAGSQFRNKNFYAQQTTAEKNQLDGMQPWDRAYEKSRARTAAIYQTAKKKGIAMPPPGKAVMEALQAIREREQMLYEAQQKATHKLTPSDKLRVTLDWAEKLHPESRSSFENAWQQLSQPTVSDYIRSRATSQISSALTRAASAYMSVGDKLDVPAVVPLNPSLFASG